MRLLPSRRRVFLFLTIFILPVLLPAPGGMAAPASPAATARWSRSFTGPWIQGQVDALVEFQGDLLAAGDLDCAGPDLADNLARLHDAAWQVYRGFDGRIHALLVHDGVAYAGGEFTSTNGIVNVARNAGSGWQSVGYGLDGAVRCLTVYRGEPVAAGDFTGSLIGPPGALQHVARLSGGRWVPLGGGVGIAPRVLAAHGDTLFAAYGSTVYAWNGSTWSALPILMNGGVEAMTVFNGSLYVGGSFPGRVARWNGSAWVLLGAAPDVLGDLLVLDGGLVAVGRKVQAWDGTAWQDFGPWMEGEARTAAVVGGRLVVAGAFRASFGGHYVHNVMAWDGTAWSMVEALRPECQGLDGPVNVLMPYLGGTLVGGDFTRAGAVTARGIAFRDDSAWHVLGSGLAGSVRSLGMYDGDPVAGGRFTTAGGVTVNNVARWDGSAWQPLGGGVTGASGYASIEALVEYDGDLYVTGYFDQAGGTASGCLARWDGSAWHAVPGAPTVSGQTLMVYDGALIFGGYFRGVGGVPDSYSLARWDGDSWSGFGTGARMAWYDELDARYHDDPGSVSSLILWDNRMILSGNVLQVDGAACSHLAGWNGSNWSRMDDLWMVTSLRHVLPNVIAVVHEAADVHGSLYVIGLFNEGGDLQSPVEIDFLARWDPASFSWLPVGGGLNDEGYAIAPTGRGFMVGGTFTQAGGLPSNYLAEWIDPAVPVELAAFRIERREGAVVLSWRTAGDAGGTAGFHVCREDASGARVRVSGELLAGGPEFTFEDAEAPAGAAVYWLEELGRDGESTWHGPYAVAAAGGRSARLALAQNAPNPFSEGTRIRFTLPARGPATLTVHDLNGRRVAEVLSGLQEAGEHTVAWDGRDPNGRPVPAGIYFYRLRTDEGTRTRKLIRIE